MSAKAGSTVRSVVAVQDEAVIGRLEKTVLDCPDPRALATFYAEVLGMTILEDQPDWVVIGRREHMRTRVPEGRPLCGPPMA